MFFIHEKLPAPLFTTGFVFILSKEGIKDNSRLKYMTVVLYF